MSINILNEIKNDFLVYAQEVNQNRSFPDVRDGLKPSQRAALYTMYRKGYTSNKPHVKSAKITGAIIGELWPHGDSSAYESIVRMSQPWINNISEVDFHGANGSLQGGPDAASSRYTEARLSKAIEDGFFTNIKKDVVDMIPNFSEDDEWPSVLPAIFPRLFVNGSQGIGYTVAQEWEPGNLSEFVAKVSQYLDTGDITYDNIYPDYPTGGIIINKSDIPSIYKTGKGTVIVRGKTEIRDKYIKITELPYQVYAEPFIQKIKDLVNNETITGIEDICNKSDDNGLLIEIECSEDPNLVLKQLYKQTELQSTFSANQMALVNGVPTMLSLVDYIKIYIDHNITCLVREYTYDLHKAEARLEVVNGLLRALTIIDQIIILIKGSKSTEVAKQELVIKFGFTEVQAKAIVEMRLGRLANLEHQELVTEASDLTKIINKCNKLLGSKKAQQKEFMARLEAFCAAYSWNRHTEITDIDLAAENKVLKEKTVEQFMVILTKGGNIKRVIKSNYKPAKAATEHDEEVNCVEVTEKDRLILISSNGTMYKLVANKINICNANATGQATKDLVGEKIVAIFSGTESGEFLFMITKRGQVKKVNAQEIFNLSKNVGAPVMKVADRDEIISCQCVTSAVIKVEYKTKLKTIKTDDYNTRGRQAGGVQAVPTKGENFIKLK